MPKIRVNGVTLAYELFGEGPPVVWTPSGWSPRNNFSYLVAGRLSANYRVLLWDRRNTGASDIGIEDAPSDIHLIVDDLHHLLEALDMSPAYLAGKCSGQTLSLMMAHRYPADVKGLILVATPTDDLDISKPIGDALGNKAAAVAEEKGMQDYLIQKYYRDLADCRVKLDDFAKIAQDWLECSMPGVAGCAE